MKKFGFVTPWYGENIPGGAEMELRGLAHHLHSAGVSLEILTTCVEKFASDWNYNFHPEGLTEEAGIPVRRFSVRKRNTAAFDAVNLKLMTNQPITPQEERVYVEEMINSPKLYRYMESHVEEYALFVFIPYMFGTTYYGLQVAPEKSVMIPCLHDECYAYLEIFRELFRSIGGMVFNAAPEADLASRLYDLSAVKTTVLGVGVNTDISGHAARFREKYSIQQPFILYAGRKEKGKNVHQLIDYFVRFRQRWDEDLLLVLIGGGDIHIPENNGIVDLGFVPEQDKYDAYSAARVLCQPSTNESFSLVIMESWLCGRPVLVHEKCAVTTDFVKKSNGGLYFIGYNDFAGSLDYLLNHKDIAANMGRLGRQYVLDNFEWHWIVEKYTEFFRIVSESHPPKVGVTQ